MKTIILIPLCLVSIFSSGQHTEKFVAEISPVNIGLHTTLSYNFQGKLSYQFNKYFSLSARHNQELYADMISSTQKSSPYPYKKNSLSDIQLGITLVNSKQPRLDPTEDISPKSWNQKLFRADLGLTYYKFAAMQTDYYSYDLDDQGNYSVINSINRLSVSLGFSFIIRENNIKDPNAIKLKRQHSFSAGVYYGLNYDLQGYVKIDGENPSIRPPKNYGFDRSGYYLRYNFRQQINKHLFLGADLFLSKMPYVKYTPNTDLFVLRGGEAEPKIQPYAGIIIGWAF
ncbi:hypothetical protein [Fluviicola sp.]|uniref:hypothetical protein n=1 Tax=Fluviicola sp. TaxID=1917219 RepID=UPI0031D33710